MKTATMKVAGDLPGQVGIFRVRPEGWPHPTCSVLGQGPWLPRPWSIQPNLPPLRLAYDLHLRDLDAQQTWDRLHALVDGAEPILVTEEAPAPAMIRVCIRAWFRRALGERVVELGPWT